MSKIWLHKEADLPGPGNSIMEVITCAKPTSAGRQFFVAHFVPAHQVIELEFYKDDKSEPYRTRIPLGSVKRFD